MFCEEMSGRMDAKKERSPPRPCHGRGGERSPIRPQAERYSQKRVYFLDVLVLVAPGRPVCWSMSLHAFSHLRHSWAHFFICSSSGNFSHVLPQRSHASAQAL